MHIHQLAQFGTHRAPITCVEWTHISIPDVSRQSVTDRNGGFPPFSAGQAGSRLPENGHRAERSKAEVQDESRTGSLKPDRDVNRARRRCRLRT